MKAQDKELAMAREAGAHQKNTVSYFLPEELERFAALIRADERENFVAFIQEYPYWLGDNAKQEIIAAIRARGNT